MSEVNKPRPALLPAEGLLAMARVMAYGAEKHGVRDWETNPKRTREDHLDAALRHILKYMAGTARDEETMESHLVHAATRLLMAYEV